MIIEALFNLIFLFVETVIGTLSFGYIMPEGFFEFINLLGSAAYFFPIDVIFYFFAMIIVYYSSLLTWSLVEWVYKKIPGVD